MYALTQVLETFVFAQAADPPSGFGGFGMLPLFVIIGFMFYLIILKPDKKRRRQQEQMQNALAATPVVGDAALAATEVAGKVSQIAASGQIPPQQ